MDHVGNPQTMVISPRDEHYLNIFETVRFNDWNRFNICLRSLEGLVLSSFTENKPTLKLVGSSATGTMRKKGEDLDFAVAFQKAISNEDFLGVIKGTELVITDVNQNKKYGYIKISGVHEGMSFVLVPMLHPNGQVTTYEQDAFYHPDFIKARKRQDHSKNVILMKEFFEQAKAYKEVKGIGCEMLALHFRSFDEMLNHLAKKESLRVNFSKNSDCYSKGPMVIDYPHLGGRSFTDKVTDEVYVRIKDFAIRVLEDYKSLKVVEK